ncbi:MAG: molybdopterin-dependent oxidoreductase [Actinomycetota bacterium]|nr:molybdopterin-dependent oxidoreductase [Actinomycetota bacterium]
MRSLGRLCVVLAVAALLAVGCGEAEKTEDSRFLESEKRLEGMYEACQTIEVLDSLAEHPPIEVEEITNLEQVDVETVLIRSNGMGKPGVWSGVRFSDVLDMYGIDKGFSEIRMEAWDGYVAKISNDIALRPDTILAWLEDGEPIPEEEGPVRLVVGSEDGFYWIYRIVSMEFSR